MGKQELLKELANVRRKCDACNKLNFKGSMYNAGENSEWDSETIGPWTDWNGNPDAKYMIVGQDWGKLVTMWMAVI